MSKQETDISVEMPKSPILIVEEKEKPAEKVSNKVISSNEKKNKRLDESVAKDQANLTASNSLDKQTNSPSKQVYNDKKVDPIRSEKIEHLIVLESKGGRESVANFRTYLLANLRKLNPELTSSSSSNKVRRFTVKLNNGIGANFKIRTNDFIRFKLQWKVNSENEIKDMWYRLNSGELIELDLSEAKKS